MSQNQEKPTGVGDGNMYVEIKISNKTNYDLTLISSSCDSGSFTTDPVSTIKPNEIFSVTAQGTDGTATGVTPVWTYQLEGTDATITWNIDIPYDGAGSGTVDVNTGSLTGIVVDTNPPFYPHADVWCATTEITDEG